MVESTWDERMEAMRHQLEIRSAMHIENGKKLAQVTHNFEVCIESIKRLDELERRKG